MITDFFCFPFMSTCSGCENLMCFRYLVCCTVSLSCSFPQLMKSVTEVSRTEKYPMFMEVTLWKKCEPNDESSGKFARLTSTITRAFEICDHTTGIPRKGSRVPQRP